MRKISWAVSLSLLACKCNNLLLIYAFRKNDLQTLTKYFHMFVRIMIMIVSYLDITSISEKEPDEIGLMKIHTKYHFNDKSFSTT